MKPVVLIILLVGLVACSKEMDRKQCGKVSFVTEYYSLDKIKRDEQVVWQSGSVVCGEQFNNYKIMAGRDTIMTPYCINGVTQWYEKHVVRIE